MGIGGNDAVTAKKSVETSNGDSGIPWVGGQAGGAGQPTLQFTGDIVKAGYNINMNRPITTAGPIPPASATRLSEVWNTPADARDWVVEVVGENIVTTCDTCRKDSIPGTGLLPKLHQGGNHRNGGSTESGQWCNATDTGQPGQDHRPPVLLLPGR